MSKRRANLPGIRRSDGCSSHSPRTRGNSGGRGSLACSRGVARYRRCCRAAADIEQLSVVVPNERLTLAVMTYFLRLLLALFCKSYQRFDCLAVCDPAREPIATLRRFEQPVDCGLQLLWRGRDSGRHPTKLTFLNSVDPRLWYSGTPCRCSHE